MSEFSPIDSESLNLLIQPSTLGKVAYIGGDGLRYGLRIMRLGDGYHIFHTSSTDSDEFNFILLDNGERIINTDSEESRARIESILNDIQEIATSKKTKPTSLV